MTPTALFKELPDNSNVSPKNRERLLLRIDDLLRLLGAPGDWGYDTKLGELTQILFVQRIVLLSEENTERNAG